MPAPGELTYYEQIGPEGRWHALNKPFSDRRCGALLSEIGAVINLLPAPPCKILECGCGTGWLSYILAKSGYEVTGQDVNADAIELARSNPMFGSMPTAPHFVVGDFESMAWESDFDAIVFFDALHHALDPAAAIIGAFRALKSNGLVIASEPGTGHARKSRDISEKYDVTDRDLPPRYLGKLARKAGFSRTQAFPHATFQSSALYDNSSNLISRLFLCTARILLTPRNGITVLTK